MRTHRPDKLMYGIQILKKKKDKDGDENDDDDACVELTKRIKKYYPKVIRLAQKKS